MLDEVCANYDALISLTLSSKIFPVFFNLSRDIHLDSHKISVVQCPAVFSTRVRVFDPSNPKQMTHFEGVRGITLR